MASVKQLLLLGIFLEKRTALFRDKIIAIKRLVNRAFGRRVKRLTLLPMSVTVWRNGVSVDGKVDELFGEETTDCVVEIAFDLERRLFIINMVEPNSGEIRQKQLLFENIPL